MTRQQRVTLTEAGRRAKHEMRQVYRDSLDIAARERRYEELQTNLLPKAIRYDSVKVQTSPGDQFTDSALEAAEYGNLLSGKIRAMIRHMLEVQRRIDTLEDSRQRAILSDYFLAPAAGNRYTLQDIADRMHYSREAIEDEYRKALNILGSTHTTTQ